MKTVALRGCAAAIALAVLGGCASVPGGEARSRRDPWESFNRGVFEFNDAVDTAVMKPVARAYVDHVPRLVRTGISNFFANLGDLWSTVNLLLQAKPQEGLETWMRFVANTVFGLAGVLDPATEFGLERRPPKDLGQTLGWWGMGSGPYLVLPLLGPSDLRDALVLPADLVATSPTWAIHHVPERNSAIALQAVDKRAALFPAEKVLEGMALDRYTLIRDAYLSRRRSLVYDGNPPDDDEGDESAPSE